MLLPELAQKIATAAHDGQTDRAGRPYITHPARVADRVAAEGPEIVAAAWLHDVIEDTDLTPHDLLQAGIPARVVDVVVALSHDPGESLENYIGRVRQLPEAVLVKKADLADNTSPERVLALDPATRERLAAKYRLTAQLLEQ